MHYQFQNWKKWIGRKDWMKGLDKWIGQVDWTSRLDERIGQVDWTKGLDKWIGRKDLTGGFFMPCLVLSNCKHLGMDEFKYPG